MKILYGVQATGNGHITRARALNKYFKQNTNIEIDYLFSGRAREDFFDMEEFGDFTCCKGLTFAHEAGEIKLYRTIQQNSLMQLWKDIKQLDLSGYDIVLSDFEPITSWAAKRSGKTCIGIGHQQAFYHDVPKRGDAIIPSAIMKYFAPASVSLGLHWHHFNAPILPPIAEVHRHNEEVDPNKVVVYLGFEDPEEVIQLLEPFDQQLFCFYGPFPRYESRGHIQLKPLSREGFKQDLATASGVICNAGFELTSEAIQLGLNILIKPLHGQMEQLSNAKAIEQLGLGMAMDSLDPQKVEKWLTESSPSKVIYPDVAKAIAEWIDQKGWDTPGSTDKLIESLWNDVVAEGTDSFPAGGPKKS